MCVFYTEMLHWMWNLYTPSGLIGKILSGLCVCVCIMKVSSLHGVCVCPRGAVLCVVMNNTGEQCYSGGVDGTIQCWNTPSPNVDPYDSYRTSLPLFTRPHLQALICSSGRTDVCVCVCVRAVCPAWRAVRAHGCGLGAGPQQRTPAPPVLLG